LQIQANIKLKLPVMESFYTIQGEGFNTGKASYFIRLGGCDIGCVWCDVKESWDVDVHPQVPIEDIVREAAVFAAKIVVITGGEPFMHDLYDLTQLFENKEIKRFVETSGAYKITGNWDWICVSPKKFKAPLPEVLAEANELKVVVFNKSDFDWAEQHVKFLKPSCKLYLQPEWSKKEAVLPLIIDYVKDNPQWQISLQTHKYMDIP
jgi:7-carboxy-7-deazaguanine synthase